MKAEVIKLPWLFHCRPVVSCKVLEWHCKMFYHFFQSWAMFSNLNFRGFKCFGFDIFPPCFTFRHVVFLYFCYQDLFQSCFSHRPYNPGLSIWLSSTSI